eukprot:15435396-Alexandrium_andersonii.AAC.1
MPGGGRWGRMVAERATAESSVRCRKLQWHWLRARGFDGKDPAAPSLAPLGKRCGSALAAHVASTRMVSAPERDSPPTPSMRHVCPLTQVSSACSGEGPRMVSVPKSTRKASGDAQSGPAMGGGGAVQRGCGGGRREVSRSRS